MSVIEKKIRADVEKFGWHVISVVPDGGNVPHAYSIGLFATYGHPEIVVAGLPGDRAIQFVESLADEVKEGVTFDADRRYPDIISGFDVVFVRVDPAFYPEYFGRAIDYYGGSDFPVVQMIWPDRRNMFPWQPDCDDAVRKLQPVLERRPKSGGARKRPT